MRAVFGIDVSKTSSEVAILVNSKKINGYTILNDAIGFNRLLGDLKTVHKPTYVQEEVYQHLRDLSRFYQNMTEDLVQTKNCLHKVLQVTFPELENLLSTPTGEQYWNLVMAFPCKEFILSLSQSNLCEIIRQSTSKRISEKRIAYLTDKLIKLAKQSLCAVKKTSPMLEEVRYYAQELLRLSERRQVVLNDMVALAQPLPEYDILRSIPDIAETTVKSNIGELGNIRCFQSTNSCNIADFYEKRKRQYL